MSIVSNVKALVGTFNQEKALVGAFSVSDKTDGSFAALSRSEVGKVKDLLRQSQVCKHFKTKH